MLVSYNWLKELVDLKGVSPEELAEKMTLSGVAVEHIYYLGQEIEKVTVGQITRIEKHPDADKLVVCQVDVAGPEPLQIVTGATNIKEGHVIPVAVHGAKLPGGIKIKKSKLRGIESNGMLCSGDELGMDKASLPEDQQHGILILPTDTPLGGDAKEILGLDDAVLELELTPNRSDCLSMLGVAWEVAAVLGTEVTLPEIKVDEIAEETKDLVQIEIADTRLCNRYVGRIVREVKIQPSPMWMQQRLRAANVRPINNLVDITNYVMLEMGQPLHAFDYDTLQGQRIVVRTAKAEEEMDTLDGVHRQLDEEMLVIADAQVPVAIAGVMGGLDSEVNAGTKTILLESASFLGASVRHTSRKLGLRSEASLRFEKGINPEICEAAVNRAAQLIVSLGAGVITAGIVDNYPNPTEDKEVELRVERVQKILGIQISTPEVVDIMERLGFAVSKKEDVLTVVVPSRRVDIQIEEDLVEEVVRLYGYNRIPTTLPHGASTQGAKTFKQQVEDLIKASMLEAGLTEVITLTFSNPRNFDLIKLPQDNAHRQAVQIQNPLSEEQGILRTMLLPGLLEVASRNQARRVNNLAIFEMGNIFIPKAENALPHEVPTLGAVIYGETAGTWNQAPQPLDFYYLKGVVELLTSRLGVNLEFVREERVGAYHPGRSARLLLNGEPVGIIGQLHPDIAETYDLPLATCAFELNLEQVLQVVNLTKTYQELPKFPGMERDIAIVVPQDVLASQLLATITANGGKLLVDVNLFDLYQGKQIQEGFKSMAFRLKYQAIDRTLTDDEVNAIQEKIQRELAEKHNAQLR